MAVLHKWGGWVLVGVQVVEFKQPDELKDLIDLSIGNDGTSEQEVLELCRKVLRYSVHTGESVSMAILEALSTPLQFTQECLTPCGLEWIQVACVVLS